MAKKKTPAKKAAKKKTAKKAPASRPAAHGKEVTAKHLADMLGVKLTKNLDKHAIHALRKALPGYDEKLDHAAKQLGFDAKVLAIAGVTPEALAKAHAEHKHLAALEQVAGAVFRSIHEQRLLVDDAAIDMLERIARRVGALAEDHADLLVHWKFLRDYLSAF